MTPPPWFRIDRSTTLEGNGRVQADPGGRSGTYSSIRTHAAAESGHDVHRRRHDVRRVRSRGGNPSLILLRREEEAMPLDPHDLATLSRLLDEALELSPTAFDGWMAALPAGHRHLLPRLRDMLASQSARGNTGFLSDGPRLALKALDGTVAHAADLVGPYRLIREIGHGGMGTVWLAERADGTLKRQVALKLPRLAWGAGLTERMVRERDIGALLEHPNIARLYDAGVDGQGRPYLALEHIDGVPIDEWCDGRSLDVRARLELFIQVIRAVAYAHGRLIVHRDLKPSNVLVTKDGQAHLLDFGIAKLLDDAAGNDQLTRAQDRLMTPHYASPEQISGEAITVGSDVYSLGVLLFELLTKRHPYKLTHNSIGAVEMAILEGEPELASSKAEDKGRAKSLRGELDAILAKALRREPQNRYANADAFADDLRRHLDGELVLARPDSLGYRMEKIMRRHRTAFAAAGLVVISTVGGLGASLVQAHRANDAAERARVVKEFVVDVFKVNERGTQGSSELRYLPAELLLERGARLIETKFPGRPQLQAELYGVVGGIFADIGANDLAKDYAMRELEALVAIDASALDQGQAELFLSQAFLALGRYSDAELRVRRALSLIGSDVDKRTAGLVLLGRILRFLNRNTEAEQALESAETLLRKTQRPSLAAARAMTLRGQFLVDANHFDAALALYLKAIDQASEVEGSTSGTANEIRLSVANLLISHDRPEESKSFRESALASLRAIGTSGQIRAAVEESAFLKSMYLNGQLPLAEAMSGIKRNQLTLQGVQFLPLQIKASVELNLAEILLSSGDVASADRLIAIAASSLRQTSEGTWDKIHLKFDAGWVAMYAGRHNEANENFRSVIDGKRAMGEGHHPWAAMDYAFAAINLVMDNRFDEAETLLGSAPQFDVLEGGGSSGSDYHYLVVRTMARIKLARGDVQGALRLLPPDQPDGPSLQYPFDNRQLRGEILCQSGQRTEGLELLNNAIEAETKVQYEHHPELARARAVTGLCALALGQIKRAAYLAALTRTSFKLQPNVSKYFKMPSERLDRLLATATASRRASLP